jgi:hypothetical protein
MISRSSMSNQIWGNKMPLTAKGKKIKSAMEKEYGKERGKRVFYASENKGTIKGVAKKMGGGRMEGYHRMPDGRMMKDSAHRMAGGGKVTRGDGCCMRGKTRGKAC